MIYTANFYTAKKYMYNEDCVFISINKKETEGSYNYPQLTPRSIDYYGHENNILDWDDYKYRYISSLDKEFLNRFISKLRQFDNNDRNIIIFSRDYHYKFSYRRILAEYIYENYGIKIIELNGSGEDEDNISIKLRFKF